MTIKFQELEFYNQRVKKPNSTIIYTQNMKTKNQRKVNFVKNFESPVWLKLASFFTTENSIFHLLTDGYSVG